MERAMPQALPSHEADSRPQGIVDTIPPRPTVGDAMRRWWPLVVLAVLAFGALGAYMGYVRQPVYQATSSLSVGLLDLNTQSVPGFAVGGEVVAGGFSRSVQTDDVIVPAARQLRMAPNQLRGLVSSTSVPSSPIFTITGTATSPAEAVRVANAVSDAMIAYAAKRSNSAEVTAETLRRYREAIRSLSQAKNRVSALRSRQSNATGAGTATTGGTTTTTRGTTTTTGSSAKSSSPPEPGALSRARADAQTQQLRVDSLAQLYKVQAGSPSGATVVQPILKAQGASSDRRSRVELYGSLGILAGLCVGTALAVLFTGRRYRRRLAS
jgi:capsular polysaccharide biosynthesis protein